MRIALAQLDLTVGALPRTARASPTPVPTRRGGRRPGRRPRARAVGLPAGGSRPAPELPAACARGSSALAAEAAAPLLVGLPVLDGDRPRNAAALCVGGEVVARYDKRLLPNYGVFDETRTFAAGRGRSPSTRAARSSLTICEDIWLPAPQRGRGAAGATVDREPLRLALPPRQGRVARADAAHPRARRRLRSSRSATSWVARTS